MQLHVRKVDEPMKSSPDLAAFVLRPILGGMYLPPQYRIASSDLWPRRDGRLFVNVGVPAWLAYATIAREAIGGLLLILGFHTRWVVVALSPALLAQA